jgi:succinate dehydrogenase flavin-adding protein (antitoxin of CptAB toxin-antitoxin module)
MEPFSFERHDFLTPQFSAISFLSSRRHLPIQQLKHDFASILKELRNELVDLINNDYANFIELSSNLLGVEEILKALFSPLLAMRHDVTALKDSLQAVVNKISDRLDQRTRIKKAKQTLQTLISIHECVQKLTSLLAAFDQVDGSQLNSVKQIERIASEYSQLTYLVSKENKHIFVQHLSKKIEEIKDQITSVLSNLIQISFNYVSQSINQEEETSLVHLMRIFVSLEKIPEAKNIFQQTIVEPFITQVYN